MKVHIGCGNVILPNWINLDIQSGPGVDLVGDARELVHIKNNSCDIIYACHVLEHFSRNEIENVLKLWNKKLRRGGILRLAVPNFGNIVKCYLEGEDLERMLGLLIGGHKDSFDKHGMIFDEKLLKNMLKGAGFTDIRYWDHKKVDHGHVDDFSQAYLPHMDKESGILMSLNMEAEKQYD